MGVVLVPPSAAELVRRNLRVMIVDDAVVVRGLLARWIQADPGLEMVASLRTGREAVNQLERVDPDVVILDVDMPELDGISALPLLLKKKPHLVVIMASTLTRRNAEISLRALSLGAADYIPKPETTREVTTSVSFRRELIDKIRHLGARARERRVAAINQNGSERGALLATHVDAPSLVPDTHGAQRAASAFRLRPFAAVAPRFLMIGSSTGGPQALTTLIPRLGKVLERAPILITQHMPPTFTTILAEHLQRSGKYPAHEAVDGEEVKPGRIYVAPGGKHMRVQRANGHAVIALDDGPQVDFCKPAVDPMFSSGAVAWGAAVLGVVLTGMGSDGMHGTEAIAAAGGSVIAQDEATSVVWGMPAQAVSTGMCSAVLALDDIAPKIVRLFEGDRA